MVTKYLCAAIVLISAGISGVTLGNARFVITNPHDGQHPYRIVVKNDDKETSDDPGLYAVIADGSYRLIVPGAILKEGAHSGIFHHLSITKLTDRHEAILVANGELYLSQQMDQGTATPEDNAIRIGSEDFEIIDPFTDESITLPTIKSLKDVTIMELPAEADGQAVILSVRNPHAEKGSSQTGFTFGFFLRKKEEKKSWAESNQGGFLLDYSFRTKDELNLLSLHHINKGAAISTRLIQSQIKSKATDTYLIKEWRASLNQAYKKFTTGGIKDLKKPIPYIDLKDGEMKLSEALYARICIRNSNLQLYQFSDPLSGTNYIQFVDFKDHNNNSRTEPGNVSEFAGTNSYQAFRSSDRGIILNINKNFYYLYMFQTGQKWDYKLLALPSSTPLGVWRRR